MKLSSFSFGVALHTYHREVLQPTFRVSHPEALGPMVENLCGHLGRPVYLAGIRFVILVPATFYTRNRIHNLLPPAPQMDPVSPSLNSPLREADDVPPPCQPNLN